jgi:hypothetical protein
MEVIFSCYQTGPFGGQRLAWIPPRAFFFDFRIPNSDFEIF